MNNVWRYTSQLLLRCVQLKIALGTIVRSLDDSAPLLSFVDNALMHGHKLDCAIVAYTDKLCPQAVHDITKKIPLFAVNINSPEFLSTQFRRLGLSAFATQELLNCPVDTARGLVPYGFNRNIVLLEALLRQIDILFFVDSDVLPIVLRKIDGEISTHEVDFFGAHLEFLRAGALITTGEYSGYNILPPARFDGMDDLLIGVQKEDMIEYWQSSEVHRSLVFQSESAQAKPCTKILGGNTAFKLEAFSSLPPFFSSHYTVKSEMFLSRGEDTLLGVAVAKSEIPCIDICLNPLHDTYKNFPVEPNLRSDRDTQDRFYYAIAGWVGRNPFYNYLLRKDFLESKELQREHFVRGIVALAKYTLNIKFNTLIDNFDESWSSLDRYVSEYEKVVLAWETFIERVGMR